TRLQRTATSTGPSSGPTLARMYTGPTMNEGFGRVARKTWARAAPGVAASRSPARTQALDLDRRELAREVLLERQLLLDDAILQERALHHRERRDVNAAVDREERTRDLVGAQHRLGRPAERPRADLGRLPRVLTHQLERREHRPHGAADQVGLRLDGVLRRVLDLADPLPRDRVEAEQHLGLALELCDRAAVAPHVGGGLLAGPHRDGRLEEGGAGAEGDELGREALARNEPALARHEDRPRHRAVAEDGRADLHGGRSASGPRPESCGDRGGSGEEATAGDRGRGHEPVSLTFARAFHTLGALSMGTACVRRAGRDRTSS